MKALDNRFYVKFMELEIGLFFAYGHLKLPQDPFPQKNYPTRTT